MTIDAQLSADLAELACDNQRDARSLDELLRGDEPMSRERVATELAYFPLARVYANRVARLAGGIAGVLVVVAMLMAFAATHRLSFDVLHAHRWLEWLVLMPAWLGCALVVGIALSAAGAARAVAMRRFEQAPDVAHAASCDTQALACEIAGGALLLLACATSESGDVWLWQTDPADVYRWNALAASVPIVIAGAIAIARSEWLQRVLEHRVVPLIALFALALVMRVIVAPFVTPLADFAAHVAAAMAVLALVASYALRVRRADEQVVKARQPPA